MVIVVTLGRCKEDIAGCFTAIAQQNSIFFAQCQSNDAFAGLGALVAVQIGDDLFFHFIFILRVNDPAPAVNIGVFDIDKDIITLLGDGFGLGPVYFLEVVAVFVFLQNGIA